MESIDFQSLCIFKILDYVNANREESEKLNSNDVYVVWLSKTLQNNKGLFSTNEPDGLYFECTYNGNKEELYLDVYEKLENKPFKITSEDWKTSVF